MAKRKKKSAFQTVTTHLGGLTRAELEELQNVVAAVYSDCFDSAKVVRSKTNEELMRLSFQEARAG